MTNKEIEQIESYYLKKYYHFLMYCKEDILRGLQSRDIIKDQWFESWNKGKDKEKKTSFSVGAERVIYYYLSNSKGLGEPNSTPVSSDLTFETKDAFIHIDLKTVSLTNIGDISGSIFIGNNQNSYNGEMKISGNTLEYKSASLPKYYKYEKFIKPCLTYFITILHDFDTLNTLMINIISMPNGQLYSEYGGDILSAGKTKNEEQREKGEVSTVRFQYKNALDFKLLDNKKRVRVIHFDEIFLDTKECKKNLKDLKNLYLLQED